jgi:hypothetical protein
MLLVPASFHVIVSWLLPRGHSTGSEHSIFAPRLCNTGHYERRVGIPLPHQTTILQPPVEQASPKMAETFGGLTVPCSHAHGSVNNGPPVENELMGYLPIQVGLTWHASCGFGRKHPLIRCSPTHTHVLCFTSATHSTRLIAYSPLPPPLHLFSPKPCLARFQ